MPGRTDRDEHIRHRQRHIDFIHPQGHFAKPHDVRAQRCRKLAAMALIFRGHISCPVQDLSALRTAHFEQFTVHMDDVLATGALMQVIDILRHQ